MPKPDFAPAIARLREITARSADALLLADGPPHPDAVLLDLCAEALHHLTAARAAYDARPWHRFRPSMGQGEWGGAAEREDERLMAEYYRRTGLAKRSMTKAKKLRASTPQGIYAKALCVRASRTGAAEFAMTLADDLLSNPALRAALWPADRQGGDA